MLSTRLAGKLAVRFLPKFNSILNSIAWGRVLIETRSTSINGGFTMYRSFAFSVFRRGNGLGCTGPWPISPKTQGSVWIHRQPPPALVAPGSSANCTSARKHYTPTPPNSGFSTQPAPGRRQGLLPFVCRRGNSDVQWRWPPEPSRVTAVGITVPPTPAAARISTIPPHPRGSADFSFSFTLHGRWQRRLDVNHGAGLVLAKPS